MDKSTITLYYDGDCPICSRYRDYVAIRQAYDLELKDARQHLGEIRDLADQGYDINTGMILVTPDGTVQGASAVVAMRAFTKGRGLGDGAFRVLLKAPWLVKLGYPFARGLRHVLLKATGRETRVELDR